MYDFKILSPFVLYTFIEQNIFFPETWFAYPFSEQKITVGAPKMHLSKAAMVTHIFQTLYTMKCTLHQNLLREKLFSWQERWKQFKKINGDSQWCDMPSTTLHYATHIQCVFFFFLQSKVCRFWGYILTITPAAKTIHPFASVWYEIGVLWPNLKPIRSLSTALGFWLQTDMNRIFQTK